MKFTGFVATLAVAGAASAAAIPRDDPVSSTVQGALSQLNEVLSSVQSVAGGATGGSTGGLDLGSLTSQLTNIQSQLSGVTGLLPIKRDVASGPLDAVNGVVGAATSTVNGVAGPVVKAADGVAGGAVGTVEGVAGSVASPVLGAAGGVTGGLVPRESIDIGTLLPLAQQVVSDVQGNVAPNTIVDHVNSLTHLVSLQVALPLSLPALPVVGSV